MVGRGRPADEVLVQILAVQQAIKAVAAIVLLKGFQEQVVGSPEPVSYRELVSWIRRFTKV